MVRESHQCRYTLFMFQEPSLANAERVEEPDIPPGIASPAPHDEVADDPGRSSTTPKNDAIADCPETPPVASHEEVPAVGTGHETLEPASPKPVETSPIPKAKASPKRAALAAKSKPKPCPTAGSRRPKAKAKAQVKAKAAAKAKASPKRRIHKPRVKDEVERKMHAVIGL